jgi:hypothetical protein
MGTNEGLFGHVNKESGEEWLKAIFEEKTDKEEEWG